MSLKNAFRIITLFICMFAGRIVSFAQDPIERLWYNEEKTAKIKIFKATDGKFYGKIVWMKEPNNPEGNPKLDTKNPKKEHRNDPIMGLQLLRGFDKDGENVYTDGTIYDPKNGKDYSCKMTRKGNSLEVRGYVGISLLGRTTTWTEAD
jgi:uncharacterized protein (DUF2147 family)